MERLREIFPDRLQSIHEYKSYTILHPSPVVSKSHLPLPKFNRESHWALPVYRELQISRALPDPNCEPQISVGTAGPQCQCQNMPE